MNRHLRLAFLIAPLLAIGGWIAADYYAARRTTADRPAFPLQPQGPCRPAAECTLKGLKLVLRLRFEPGPEGRITASASRPLEGIRVQTVGGSEGPVRELAPQDPQHWQGELPLPAGVGTLRLVAMAPRVNYFAEIPLGEVPQP